MMLLVFAALLLAVATNFGRTRSAAEKGAGAVMAEGNSIGQLEMPALARRLQAHAAELQAEPSKAFGLRMASELLDHLARLTIKLAKPAPVPVLRAPTLTTTGALAQQWRRSAAAFACRGKIKH
jgi:hypothetical protein